MSISEEENIRPSWPCVATTGNKNSTDPCDAPKRVFLEVDGEVHEVVRKNNYLWCHCCRVRCYSNVIMDGHLRSKMHSKLNKVWTSIKAGRTNTNTREGLPCGSQVNTNDSTEIPGVIKGDINMTTEVDESSPVENPVQKEIHLQSKKHNKSNNVWTSIKALRTNTDTKKGLPSCGSQLNTNGPVENPVHKEIHLQSKKHSKLNKVWTSIKAVRTNTSTKEGLSSCGSQVNTNGSSEIPAVIEGDINMATEVDESGPVENPVWKEITRMAAIKAVRKNTDTKEGLPSCGSQVNTNGSTEIPAVTPRLKELIMFKAQQESKSDPSSAPKETYANDSSQKRKPSQMTSKVQPPAKKRKYNQPKKTVSSDDHRLKEQRADSRLQEEGEVSRGKAEALVEMKVEGDSKGGNTSSNQPKPYLHSDKCTAYMSKINLKATELHIRGFFSDIGGVVDIRLQRDRFTKKSRGLAHVDFSDKDHLEAAIRKNKRKFFGKNVTIKDSSKHKKNRKAGTSAKANTKVWTSIKAFLSKKASIAPSDPSKSKKNREADTSAKANTKVWTSIKAVRTNCNTKEGLPSSCGSQVNTNGSTKIPAVIKGDINMTTAVDESGPVENLVRKQITRMAAIKAVRTNTDTKEGLPSSCGSQVNTNGCTEIPAVIEGDLNMSTIVDESGPVENPVQKEITRMATIWAMFSS